MHVYIVMMKSGHVTIKDLARELNISPSTVSRALQDHPDISRQTKKLVNELAVKLNYQPNVIALSLRKSRSNTIGIVIPEIVHFFFATILSGIEDIAVSMGYNVIICQSNESFEREVANTQALYNSRVDGLILDISQETTDLSHLKSLEAKGVPLVIIDRKCEDLNVDTIVVDDFDGAYQAVDHLIRTGCRQIGHLAGPQAVSVGKDRFEGYRKALQDNGIEFREEMVVDCFSSRIEDGKKSTEDLLNQFTPDAIFASNDMAAIGSITVLKEKGYSIPDQISVIGFSDWQLSSLIEPSLTTVAQPGYTLGEEAARMLIDRINTDPGEHEPSTKILKTELILRNSTRRIEG